ncbi:hypothetical protein NUACC26_037520 [Scytonema sp. NUACC26]
MREMPCDKIPIEIPDFLKDTAGQWGVTPLTRSSLVPRLSLGTQAARLRLACELNQEAEPPVRHSQVEPGNEVWGLTHHSPTVSAEVVGELANY